MIKSCAFAAALALGGLLTAGAASAAPTGPGFGVAADAPVSLVADGCGRGFFRGPAGFCRPFRGGYGPRAYGPPRPRFYGPRVYGHGFYGAPRVYGPGFYGPRF